jgi:hypothetical protein
LTGIFGELIWRVGFDDNQSFDKIIDDYLRIRHNATECVMIMMTEADYDDIVDFVTTLT